MDKKVFFLWLATILLWGISPILEKIGLKKIDPLVGLFIRTIFAFIGISITILLTSQYEKLKTITQKEFWYLGLSGITAGFLGMLFYFSLLKNDQASKVVPLTATYPFVATLFAIIFLKENINLYKFLGLIFTVIGIYLLFKSE